ncbi:MAG: putative CRISPR-associated protein [Cyanothece sp. SIO2G6]|nr:putative CRISPR-associated protein [Cyanothece sp. SIO2G6]
MVKTFVCSTGTSTAKVLNTKKYSEFVDWVQQWDTPEQAAQALFQQFSAYAPEEEHFRYPLSAEIHSLVRMNVDKGDRVLLLASDTDEGYCCALAVAHYLEHYWPGINVVTERITGLQVTDAQQFQSEGVVGFVRRILAEIQAYGQNVILNPTGGFKALVPYTVLIGMIKGIECRYIFEQSSTLLELPPLPLEFQRSRFDAYRSLFEAIERESAVSKSLWEDTVPYEERRWFSPLIEVNGDEITLSAVGFLFLDEVRESSALVPFISRKAYSDIFDNLALRKDCDPIKRIHFYASNWNEINDTDTVHHRVDHYYWLKTGDVPDRYLVSIEGWRFLVWRVVSKSEFDKKYVEKVVINERDRKTYFPFMRMEFLDEQAL